jgi:hypothetical protein
MRFEVTDRHAGEAPLGAVLMLPLFGLPLGAWLVHHGYVSFGTCGLKRLADIPCLMCGATRATFDLLAGHLWSAITLQPLVILLYALLASWGVVSLVSFVLARRVHMRLTSHETAAVKLAIISLPLANWAYLIAAGV